MLYFIKGCILVFRMHVVLLFILVFHSTTEKKKSSITFGSEEELILYKKITKTIKFSKLWNA